MQRFAMLSSVVLVSAICGGLLGAEARSVSERLASRDFPSVFQPWGRVENLPALDTLEAIAKHDLAWSAISLCGLRWDTQPRGLAEGFDAESIVAAQAVRRRLLALNPNLLLIAEIRYRDADAGFLPEGHRWWKRDEDGQIVKGWEEGRYLRLDYTNPAFGRHVAARAKAVLDSGVADGILLDWWQDDEPRLALVREIRAAIGEEPLILVNSNDRRIPKTAPYVNGLFMECYRSETPADWRRIERTLAWAERNLRGPRVNCVEVWYQTSRRDLPLMRAVTTLTLTHSNGYCLFSDPNPLPTPDHRHDWYPFWDSTLGRPTGVGIDRADGAVQREFDHGTVVYNPMGNGAVTVRFGQPHTSRATGRRSETHALSPCDGDIYLRSVAP
jgi:hypothetical protein